MADETYDFAVIGSSLSATMLAGLLAQEHGKRVILVGRPVSGLRLPRSLDLLFAPVAQPGTWALLAQAAAEIGDALAKLGASDVLSHVDMAVEVELDATAELFDHVAHMASAYGVHVRRSDRGWLFRGIPCLDTVLLQQKLPGWLEGNRVATADADAHPLGLGKSGAAQLEGVAAMRIVLADDDVVLRLPADLRPPALQMQERIVALLEPVKPAKASVQHWPDRAVSLVRRLDNQALAFVDGVKESDTRLASVLHAPARRLAAGQSHQFLSGDGAPLVGTLRKGNLLAAAGLADLGAFLAPAIARLFAGAARPEERDWFKTCDPRRGDRAGGRV